MADTHGEWQGTGDNPITAFGGTFKRVEGGALGPDERAEDERDWHDDEDDWDEDEELEEAVSAT